MWGWPNHLHDP